MYNYGRYNQDQTSLTNKRPWSKFETAPTSRPWNKAEQQEYTVKPAFDKEAYYKKKEEIESAILHTAQMVTKINSKLDALSYIINKDIQEKQELSFDSKPLSFKLDEAEI